MYMSMTKEVAFELGKMAWANFYDLKSWRPNVERFEYWRYLKWGNPYESSDNTEFNLSYITFYGELDEIMINNMELKKSYIRGACRSYAAHLKASITCISVLPIRSKQEIE